jgi:protein involved in polysaccharide export with SLBB domain
MTIIVAHRILPAPFSENREDSMKPIIVLIMCCIFVFTLEAADGSRATDSGNAARPLPFKAGDALGIITYPDSATFPAGIYPIDGEGYVDFPLLGYVKVTTLTADSLGTLLSKRYVEFMRYPHMRIRPLVRIAFNGGFHQPGLFWVDPHASLWEALREAGGTQRWDGFGKIKWERNNLVLQENVVPVLEEGKSLYQIGFKTGDQLTVIQRPARTGWEIFRMDVLPLITTTVTVTASLFTIYNTFRLYEERYGPE